MVPVWSSSSSVQLAMVVMVMGWVMSTVMGRETLWVMAVLECLVSKIGGEHNDQDQEQ